MTNLGYWIMRAGIVESCRSRQVEQEVVALVILACLALAGQASAGQAPAMKDPQIASRALTNADLDKYASILAKVTQATPDSKKADVDIAKKLQDKIAVAKK